MSSTPIAENYQLKWDSYYAYMNMSLANFFKNEKFADVMLLTSNAEGGPGIPAHKIILTSCSSYFASIFDTNLQSATNGTIYIVLPPELSRRAIKILVQYMYSGEATVSNDILKEVLRGGELLRIRGLCRNDDSTQGQTQTRSHSSDSNSTNNYNTSRRADTSFGVMNGSEEAASARIFDKNHDYELRNLRSLPVSTVPKESPVIIKSPKSLLSSSQIHQQTPEIRPSTNSPPSTQNIYPKSLRPSSSQIHQQTLEIQPSRNSPPSTQNISIRKDVAIDPGECLSSSKYYQISNTTSGRELHQQLQQDCSPVHSPLSPEISQSMELQRPNSEDICSRCPGKTDLLKDQIHSNRNPSPRMYLQRTSFPENNRLVLNSLLKKNLRVLNENYSDSNLQPKIKEEPIDWSQDQQSNSSDMEKHILPSLETIKTESDHSVDQTTDKEDEDDLTYSPLTCELCSETFTVPKDWVRHIEGHMDSTTTHILPKKKRKITEQTEKEFIATLKCDLCSTYYVTPAEWVRHIQNSHTETELAMCNVEHGSQKIKTSSTAKSSSIKKKKVPVSQFEEYLGKTCAICNKKFPSYASMVIHRRTHSNK